MYLKLNDLNKSAEIAHEVLKEVKGYFGHQENELVIDPKTCILHEMYDRLQRISFQSSTGGADDPRKTLIAEISTTAKDLEKEILQLQGEMSPALIEIYHLQAFLLLQDHRNYSPAMLLEKRATKIAEATFG